MRLRLVLEWLVSGSGRMRAIARLYEVSRRRPEIIDATVRFLYRMIHRGQFPELLDAEVDMAMEEYLVTEWWRKPYPERTNEGTWI